MARESQLRDAMGQVVFDSTVHAPFLYFPAFYLYSDVVQTAGKEGWRTRALARWRSNFWIDMREYVKVWTPAMAVNFIFVPAYLRVPYIAGVSALWTVILSMMRGGQHDVEELQEGDREPGRT